MLRFISVSLLLLLLHSCVQQPVQIGTKQRASDAWGGKTPSDGWAAKLEQAPGTHISRFINAWGEPQKRKNNEYLWSKREVTQGGGYYEPDGHTNSKVYKTTSTGVAKHVGYIDTPKERYVEPYVSEESCDIRITTDKKGIITRVAYEGIFLGRASKVRCPGFFPFPKD